MKLPLSIWITGKPVRSAEKVRGNFFSMIKAGVAPGFPGPLVELDVQDAGARLPLPTEVSGVVISGSPARILDADDWMLRVEASLKELNAARVPILGICFGHQLLGRALGGTVGVNPKGREIGCMPLERLASDPLIDAAQSTFTDAPSVVMTHLDSVLEVPPGTQVLAQTNLEKNAALRFSENCWGVQFHPEMDSEIIGYYLKEREKQIVEEGLDVDKIRQRRRESAFGKALLAEFGRICAKDTRG